MTPFLRAFTDELVKTATTDAMASTAFREAKRETRAQPTRDSALRGLRGGGAPVSRDYLASTLIGAASVPLLGLMGKAIARKMNNREVRRMLRKISPERRGMLESELHVGKLVGRAAPHLPPNMRPLMNHGELAAGAASGAIGSSALQMVRDYFAGSKSTGEKP